ncbi:MAG: hypothetical protein AAGM22_12065 [Acidobacteriota bacterium]
MNVPNTLPFETFWGWLTQHTNCILRAGTPEAILYDDEALHWQFYAESESTLLIQAVRGKRLAGEILIEPELISYVEMHEGEQEGEFVFDLISENENERMVSYYLVMAHGYLEDDTAQGPVH